MVTTAVVVGAGQRGRHVYGAWALAHPDRLRIVAVADPFEARREAFATAHGIEPRNAYCRGEELFARGRIADACVIASPDRTHHALALRAIQLGYHVLLEKPMATSLEEVVDLVRTAEEAHASLQVAHVLRHTPFFRRVHELVAGGRLGQVVTVEHRENVSAAHMAHSYVRGNWGKAATSAPMIVAKCCHDFDILTWNLPGRVRRLASAGSLLEFLPERAPPGATARCTDPCPVPGCPYDARRIYLDPALTRWPVEVITDDLSEEGRLHALRTGPYGRCAYHAGSDVVDHQVVVMELESGTTAALHMHGHSHQEGRTMRYDGTRATLRARFGRQQEIEIGDHVTGEVTREVFEPTSGGHGGGDAGAIEALLSSVSEGRRGLVEAEASLESHLLAFAAEEARLAGTWIEMAPRRQEVAGLLAR